MLGANHEAGDTTPDPPQGFPIYSKRCNDDTGADSPWARKVILSLGELFFARFHTFESFIFLLPWTDDYARWRWRERIQLATDPRKTVEVHHRD